MAGWNRDKEDDVMPPIGKGPKGPIPKGANTNTQRGQYPKGPIPIPKGANTQRGQYPKGPIPKGANTQRGQYPKGPIPIPKGANTQRGQYLSPQTSIHKRAETILNIEVQQGNRTPPLLHGLVDGRKGLNHLDHKAFGCPCNVYPNPIPTPASPPVVHTTLSLFHHTHTCTRTS